MGTDVKEVGEKRIIFLKKKLGINPNHTSIGIYGRVHPYKRVDVIIRSFAKLVAKNPKLDLFIIGFCHNSIKGSLANLARSLNIDKRVHFISSPITDDLHAFNQYIEAIDICINLRRPTVGETSATLITALGFGKPCIVTNAGSYKEYPDDFVWKVDADDKYEEELLIAYLHSLCSNTALREKMSKMAFDYMGKNHHQTIWSNHYKEFILGQQ
jgi:glycosyltransferase involved in cell wall biosynthesis